MKTTSCSKANAGLTHSSMYVADFDEQPKSKVWELSELAELVAQLRAKGKKVVHAHGVFDLLHPGHIRHLQEAKSFGDVLVVTLTADSYVNKGPHRPAFPEGLRAEAMAALEVVDFVAINRSTTAVEAIDAIKPDVYAKGPDYRVAGDDISGGISAEQQAVMAHGGLLGITNDITFSSSALINRYLPAYPQDVQKYLRELRLRYSPKDIFAYLNRLQDMHVVVVGESILDEYVYCDQMGKSAKEPVLAMRYKSSEMFAGGALAVANHLAEFCKSVEVVTYLGAVDAHEAFVHKNLRPKVRLNAIHKSNSPTIVKRRYVEETLAAKLFEVYVINDDDLNESEEADLCSLLELRVAAADAVIAADFGHGLLTPGSKALLAERSKFLAVNTQINAANIRFHAISSYSRANYVCINEAELRLDARDRYSPVEVLIGDLTHKLDCNNFLVTQGKAGVTYLEGGAACSSPALATHVVDRIGSGDAVLAITSVCVASGMPADLVAFVANVIGAQKVQIMGNRSSIGRVATFKFIETLLK
jgi:rfaE bifunctional protein kinase chain/domain/rfaE bifunctional protein nucleotidyltransferase chain/domain